MTAKRSESNRIQRKRRRVESMDLPGDGIATKSKEKRQIQPKRATATKPSKGAAKDGKAKGHANLQSNLSIRTSLGSKTRGQRRKEKITSGSA
jgi:hypothetical protein